MKTVLLCLWICFCAATCSAQWYALNKDFGKFGMCLILYEDSNFVIEGGNDNNMVLNVAYGKFRKFDKTVKLYDSLYGTVISLKQDSTNYKVIDGFTPFNKGTFLIASSIPKSQMVDSNSFSRYAFDNTKKQRATADSILKTKSIRKSLELTNGNYKMWDWEIDFTNQHHFRFSFGGLAVTEGKWKQKGNFLILTSKLSQRDYVIKIANSYTLQAIYFPLMYEGATLIKQ